MATVLNRPDKLNAIDSGVLTGIRTALAGTRTTRRFARDPARSGTRILRGRRPRGGRRAGARQPRFNEFLDYWHESLRSLQDCPLPTIAAVHGIAFAGGFELTQVCDFVVLGRSAMLGDQHANFGLFPAGGSTQRLPRLVGPRVAKWMLMTGEAIDAPTALQLGLVNRIADDDHLLDQAQRMAGPCAARAAARCCDQGGDRASVTAGGWPRRSRQSDPFASTTWGPTT